MIYSYSLGLARKHRQSMVEKRQAAHIVNLLNSSDPEDVIIGLMGEAQMRAPSLSRTLSITSSTSSIPTSHTRSNTQTSTYTAPPTVQTSPTLPKNPFSYRPPGYVRQIYKDRIPICYTVEDIRARVALADNSFATIRDTETKKGIYHKTAWAGYGPNPPLDFPVHPSEMAGEGSYRISGHASSDELIRAFKERVYPMGPLITHLLGDVYIRGLNFTYDELMREIYERSSARKHRDPTAPYYMITTSKEGANVQHGFPCQPTLLKESASRVPGHRRTEWYATDPTAREWNFIHFRNHPVSAECMEVKFIAAPLPPKAQDIKKRSNSNTINVKADGQPAGPPVHVRFANKPVILGNTSTIRQPNTAGQTHNLPVAGTPPLTILNAATQTDNVACAAGRNGAPFAKLGTAPHNSRNTPSLSSKEHPLFARSVQKGGLESRIEPNSKKLTDVQEVDEETDQDAGPWEDICVERSGITSGRLSEAENVNPLFKARQRAVRPNNTRTLSDKRPLPRNKPQQQVPVQLQSRNQAQARIHAQAHAYAHAHVHAHAQARNQTQAQQQAQGPVPGRNQGCGQVQVDTFVHGHARNPIEGQISIQTCSQLQQQVKGQTHPKPVAQIKNQVQGQIEALVTSQVQQQAPSQLPGDEVRNRVLSQFQAQIPQDVKPQQLPHRVTVQGFHRTLTRIRIPAMDEDASSDALESCS